MSWDPRIYMRFGELRTRPAGELLARVSLADPRVVVDLGCGPGNSTALLKVRYGGARIIGVDNSPEMLEQARTSDTGIEWVEADAGRYVSPRDTDLVFSNATFQWLNRHEVLFPRLLEGLPSGGQLAVQMPSNFDAPSHSLLYELAHEDPWSAWCSGLRPASPVARPEAYFDWLSPLSRNLDIWTTEYQQVLEGEDPVLHWMRGTALAPYLAVLPHHKHAPFEAVLAERLAGAYPRRGNGVTLFPFKRLFIVATKS